MWCDVCFGWTVEEAKKATQRQQQIDQGKDSDENEEERRQEKR